MPELIRTVAIRPAQELTPRKISEIGFHSHPENLQSQRYLRWEDLVQQGFQEEAKQSMIQFLQSEEAICTYEQIPKDLAELIQWAAYEGPDFSIDTFAEQINFSKIWNEFGKEIKDGIISQDRTYFTLRTNLADQLLAESFVGREQRPKIDPIHVFKTLELIKEIYVRGRENLSLDVSQHNGKPILLPHWPQMADPCLGLGPKPNPRKNSLSIVQQNPDITDPHPIPQEEACRCKKDKEDPCDCQCSDECVDQNPCCAPIVPYVGELFVVKDEVKCYEAGEISFIQNIMETEMREITHRHLQREELYTETEEEQQSYDEKYQQIDERYALHEEVEKVVDFDLSRQAKGKFSLKLGKIINLGIDSTTSLNYSRKLSRKTVQNKSRDMINRAISRVEKKMRTLSSRRLLNEIETTNRHTIGGTSGAPTDLSRKYYFVNQMRKAQMYSYGYRMMLDINIPEPSELLKRLLEKGFGLRQPEKPCINIDSIDPEDYLNYVQCFGMLDLEEPRKQAKSYEIDIRMYRDSADTTIDVPSGYTATSLRFGGGHSNRQFGKNDATMILNVGGASISNSWQNGSSGPANMSQTGTLAVSVDNVDCRDDADIVGFLKFTPDPVDNSDWQKEVFRRLMANYEQDLQAYKEAKAAYEQEKLRLFNQNPAILVQMIEEQLKHAAINYISCQFFDENDAMKNRVKGCGFPQMDIPEAYREGKFVRFFEQAFEWDLMSYTLDPYFYGRKCSWVDKMKEASNDPLFTSFLKSGFARLTIPVREGFQNHVGWYLINRQFSPYSTPPIPANLVPLYQEIKENRDNFNTDRSGHIIHDTTVSGLTLAANQIILRDNTDYLTLGAFDQSKADVDIDREIFIDCVRYRIVKIHEDTSGEIILTLDRDFEGTHDTQYPWSTGALFVGAPWTFSVPTKLVWLGEDSRCLPCYPVQCDPSS